MISKSAQRSEYLRESRPANKSSFARRKAVYGVGINDADYIVATGEWCGAYAQWVSVLGLCYNKCLTSRRPTYSGCSIDARWVTFMEFRAWWIDNHRDGFQIDKDLLIPGNQVFSPDACTFVPPRINTLLLDCGANRGDCPVGVHFAGGKFTARCHNGNGHKGRMYLGRFDSKKDALAAWKKAKIGVVESLRAEMDAIDPRIYVNAKAKILSYASDERCSLRQP